MKEVYVLYGRKYWSEAVFDHDDNYFGESRIFRVFESYHTALEEFKNCVREAHEHFAECAPWSLDEDLTAKAAEANPFEDYNMYQDEYNEGVILIQNLLPEQISVYQKKQFYLQNIFQTIITFLL